jgi:drug/metabolite transporter (DMT)-like permease
MPVTPSLPRAVFWTVFSAVLVIAYTTTAKHLATDGLPVPLIVFWRCLFGLVFLFPWLLRHGVSGLATKQPFLMATRGLFTMIGLYCSFTAVSLMPIADVVAIQYTKPVFATFAAVLVLHEIMTRSRWVGALIAISGMLIIVRPGFQEVNEGVLWAIGAMISGAYTTISVKFLTRTESPDKIAAWMVLGMTVSSAIPAFLTWQWPTVEQLGWLAFTGLVANGFQRTMARGYAYADATALMPFEFSRLIFASLSGYLFFAEGIDPLTWAGAIVIFLSGLYMVRAERKERHKVSA